MEEVTFSGIFLSGGQRCLDFSEGTEISTAELETAAPETQRGAMGSCVLCCILAILLGAANAQRRFRSFVMVLEGITFPAVSGRSRGIKSQGPLAQVTETPRQHMRMKSRSNYKWLAWEVGFFFPETK